MNDLTHWLGLHHALGGTPRVLRSLLEIFPSPKNIIDLHKKDPAQLKLTPLQQQRLRNINWALVDDDLTWQQSNPRHHIVTINDPRYPSDLKEIYDPPIVLYINGDPSCLQRRQLAIVGSRNPTPAGAETAYQFAEQLGLAGLTITSGMALGIDYQAHRGALAAKAPTIAVLGSGINVIYPKKHSKLYHEIALTGAIVSENTVNMQAIAINFPKRNRIISGLSTGTLVVEASLNSGSLITARLANEQGRDVFAIPSSIKNLMSRGCHYLIKNGAKLTEDISDILGELELNTSLPIEKHDSLTAKNLDQLDSKLIECLGFCVQSAQDLIDSTGIPAKDVCSRLLNLELHGYIKAVAGGYCRTG